MGGSSKKQTIGYKYSIGAHMVLCHGPVDRLWRIRVAEKTAWKDYSIGGRINIYAPTLFGGEKKEGGVQGPVDFETGVSTQGPNDYLQSKLGTVPSFRGVVSIILRQVYIGLNPYLKNWAFRLQRVFVRQNGIPQWYIDKAPIGEQFDIPSHLLHQIDLNPAHIIRECLTDPDWGMGYQEADVDDVAFMAAADRLFDEDMGISILWDRQVPIQDFVDEIVRHIDASLYVDRHTGKFVLRLIRDDYDEGLIPTLGEDEIERIEGYGRPAWGELVNSVSVVFYDGQTGKNASITADDPAAIQVQGSVIPTTVEYPGFTNYNVASRVAARDLMALSTPLVSCTVYAKRSAASLNIGDVFKLDWPDCHEIPLIMRITGMAFGNGQDNRVRLTCTQDVFSLPAAAISIPSAVIPSAPAEPVPVTSRLVAEIPYFELVQRMGQSSVDGGLATNQFAGYVMAAAARPGGEIVSSEMYTNSGAGYEQVATVDFAPSTTLGAGIGSMDTVLPITASTDIEDLRIGSLVQVDDEIMRVDILTETTMTVGRGCLDTVPSPHVTGTAIIGWDDYAESDPTEYAAGETVSVKLTTSTSSFELSLDDAPVDSVVLDQRAFRPYAPGKFRLNGLDYPATISADYVTATWTHRDRVQQTGAAVIDHTAGNIGPEVGTTYRLRLFNESEVQVNEITAIAGTSQSVDLFDLPTGVATVQVLSERGGLLSFQGPKHTFDFAASTEFVVLPLTYDEEDYSTTMTWVRQGTSPHVTPDGFEGNGWNARLKSTTIPVWLSNQARPLTLHASVKVYPQRPMNAQGDIIVHVGADAAGLTPNAKMILRVFEEGLSANVSLQIYGGTLLSIPLFMAQWYFRAPIPRLLDSGVKGRPRAILFIDADTVLIGVTHSDGRTNVFKMAVSTWEIIDEFKFDTFPTSRLDNLAMNSSSEVWGISNGAENVVKLDLTASFASGTEVITSSWNVSTLTSPNGIEFVSVSGTDYVLLTEYATSGTAYLYVIPVAQMVDGTTFDIVNRYKRFNIGLRVRGISIKDGNLYVTRSVLTTNNLDRYDDIANIITTQLDEAVLTANFKMQGPSRYVADIDFHPTSGEAWMPTEGWSAVGSHDSFLAVWSSPADGSTVENHVTVRSNGASPGYVKLNNRLFTPYTFPTTVPVACVTIGGPPQTAAGFASGYFSGYVRNVRLQNTEMTDLEYADTIAGTTYEPNNLTVLNLTLTNPGGETGNTTGWTNETGTIAVRSANPTPFLGGYYFFGGAVASTISRQRVDLVAAGLSTGQLDGGNIWAKARWAQASYDATDTATVGLRMLNATPTQLSLTYGQQSTVPYGDNGVTPNWQRLSNGVDIPVNTRHLDAVYRSTRTSGTNNDGFVDEIALTVYRK